MHDFQCRAGLRSLVVEADEGFLEVVPIAPRNPSRCLTVPIAAQTAGDDDATVDHGSWENQAESFTGSSNRSSSPLGLVGNINHSQQVVVNVNHHHSLHLPLLTPRTAEQHLGVGRST